MECIVVRVLMMIDEDRSGWRYLEELHAERGTKMWVGRERESGPCAIKGIDGPFIPGNSEHALLSPHYTAAWPPRTSVLPLIYLPLHFEPFQHVLQESPKANGAYVRIVPRPQIGVPTRSPSSVACVGIEYPPSAATALLYLSNVHAPLSGPSAWRVVRSAARFLCSCSWECPPALAPRGAAGAPSLGRARYAVTGAGVRIVLAVRHREEGW
jgi:hypothetical protein